MASSALTIEIADVLAQLCGCWTRLDLKAVADLWDKEEPEIFFLPHEIEQPLIGREALMEYLERAQLRLQAASMRTWNLHVRPLAPDLAVALYEMHWNGLLVGVPRPMGVDSRATAVFRRRGHVWRIVHYVEAPPAFGVRLQQTYLAAVDADFLQRVGWNERKDERQWPDGTRLP
jgi:hypothetical protein